MDPKRISRATISDLAALLGLAVFSNSEMDQLLYRYGFDSPDVRSLSLKEKANHLVFGVANSPEIDDAKREQILLQLAAYTLKNPRGHDPAELLNALGADGFKWDGEGVVTISSAPSRRGASSKTVRLIAG